MGCLVVLMAGFFPRFTLFLFWILRPLRVDAAFDTFLLPLLGLIFFPFATLLYVILYTPGVGLTGWEWFWVIVCAFFDIAHVATGYTQRSGMPGRTRGYPNQPPPL